MRTIDIKGLIEKYDLNKKELAGLLFPENDFPVLALNRVMSGVAVLDANQISKFALLIDRPISELYGETDWKASTKNKVHTFTNDDFKAVLDTETWITRIFHKESLFHEEVILSGSTPLEKYFEILNNLILNYTENESN